MNTGHIFRVGISNKDSYIVRSLKFGFRCETEGCTLAQFLLQNLRNTTLKFLPARSLNYYLDPMDIPPEKKINEFYKFVAAVEYGVLDFALYKIYPPWSQALTFDVSPPISIGSVCILSSISFEDKAEEVMSLIVLDTYVLSFTLASLLFVSSVAFVFSTILRQRKATVTALLKHVWIFTADILQNQDLNVLNGNLYTMIFLSAWILASMIISKGYSGSLKCDMIVSNYQPINTVEDVMARKNLVPFIRENSVFYFAVNESDRYSKLKSRARKMNSYYLNPEIKRIKQRFYEGKGVIFASREYHKNILSMFMDTFKSRKVKKIYVGDADYEQRSLHYYLYKGLNKDVRENAVYLIGRYVETRQSQRIKSIKDFKYKEVLFRRSLSINLTKALTARFLWPAFFLYLSGILVSIIVALIEAIFYLISKK